MGQCGCKQCKCSPPSKPNEGCFGSLILICLTVISLTAAANSFVMNRFLAVKNTPVLETTKDSSSYAFCLKNCSIDGEEE